MDQNLGPVRNWGPQVCGYNSDPDFKEEFDCGAPAVKHVMFKTLDDYGFHPGVLTCATHYHNIRQDNVKMEHEIGIFCNVEGSSWNFEFNECQVDLKDFEQAVLGTTELGVDIYEEFERNSAGHDRTSESACTGL